MGIRHATKLELALHNDIDPEWWERQLDDVRQSGMVDLRNNGVPWDFGGLVGWIRSDPKRSSEYDKALEDFAHKCMMECLPIADNVEMGEEVTVLSDGAEVVKKSDMLAHRKLKIDTRMKLAEKLDRSRYGDRTQNMAGGFGGVTIVIGRVEPKTIEGSVIIEGEVK